ncbi:MAG: Grx4 family monothiol glutaredoxin [Polyangiaceae bacterium]|nr:Grx4 family monothiol glutaredoxin [Polyangiaceae bacterium]
MEAATRDQIERTLAANRVVLFMKGSKVFPQCGFSARVVDILKRTGTPFVDVNVLADAALREGIKEFGSWPTIPQLYVDGKLIGGCDIVTDLFESGELEKVLAPPSA